jgi:hypothetical protein
MKDTRPSERPAPTDSGSDVSVVIVSHNSGSLLLKTLASLAAGRSDPKPEVIVVDNASSDGSVGWAEQAFPWVRYLRLPTNRGFGAANNRGAGESSGRWVLFLNPDTEVRAGAIERLRAFLQGNARVGAVGPKLLNPDGSLQNSFRNFPTFSAAIANSHSILTRLLPSNRLSGRYLRPAMDPMNGGRVDWISGACMMIRREAGNSVGWFDEGYFVFCEDVDLCHRLAQAGWTTHYLPQAEVVHHVGISKSPPSMRLVAERHKSMWRYYTKFFRRRWDKDVAAISGILMRCVTEGARSRLRTRV